MFQKRAIFIAAAMVFFAGAAGAETTRLPLFGETSQPEDPDLHRLPAPVNTVSFDESDYLSEEQASEPTDQTSSATSRVGSSDTRLSIVENDEPLENWLDSLIFRDEGSLVASTTSQVDTVAYDSDKSLFFRRPKSFHARTTRRGSPYGLALRGGWWGIQTDGSRTKTGEYQSLQSSEFWDVDGLVTDGRKTLNFAVTGLDSEATDVRARYFGPRVSANVEYQRYLRRLDHDPLAGMTDFQQQPPGGTPIIKEDLNAGEDYAIRVQELKTNFKGNLTKNLRWRLGIWGMRKKGERQVNAMGHCFNHPSDTDIGGNPVFGTSCHVLTQRQRIDWVTTEIEPAIEATLGPATIEYARTMRAFAQDDQVTTRSYDNFGGFLVAGDLPYAVVPENFTEIDRVKANLLLMPGWDAYTQYYTGNTKNKFRNTNRRLWGFDARTTVRPSRATSLTGYAKKNVQTGQIPTVAVPNEILADVRAPINYDQSIAGLKGRWRPFYGERSWRRRLRLSGGYEYRGLARENAIFPEDFVTVEQAQTTANLGRVRASMKWNSAIESYVRYRLAFIDNPLYGIAKNGETNTGLPTEEHLVEIGGTWTPADNFLLTGTFGVENRMNTSGVSDFQEDNFPAVMTAWYAPIPQWTFSGGLAFFTNSIDQNITLGGLSDTITSRWNFRGRSDVINLGTTYAWSDFLTLSGGFEFVRGSNGFTSPAIPYDLSQFSDVLVETTRWTAGIDYQVFNGADLYFRYQFFDYEDKSQAINSGTANMFLTGINAIF